MHTHLIENAVTSIQIGVEDFRSGKPERLISSVRNIYAGILLLFKEKLRRLSPENSDDALVKRYILPVKADDGTVLFKGLGKKTVDVQEIKERFKHLRVEVDWKRFDKISDIRNNIEHYYSSESAETVQEVISNAFTIIRDFVRKELDEEPLGLLGEECWRTLLEQAEIFERERADSLAVLASLDWESPALAEAVEDMRCASCGSSLLRPLTPQEDDISQQIFICQSCTYETSFSELVGDALKEHFGYLVYMAYREGDDPPIEICYECGMDTFIVEEARCANCGFELRKNIVCFICGETLGNYDDLDRSLCSYHAYSLDKDD